MSDSMNISGIGQIAIAIADLDKAVYFYEKILKLEKLFDVPPNMAFFRCGDVRLMLTTLQGPEHDHNTSVINTASRISKSSSMNSGRCRWTSNASQARPPLWRIMSYGSALCVIPMATWSA